MILRITWANNSFRRGFKIEKSRLNQELRQEITLRNDSIIRDTILLLSLTKEANSLWKAFPKYLILCTVRATEKTEETWCAKNTQTTLENQWKEIEEAILSVLKEQNTLKRTQITEFRVKKSRLSRIIHILRSRGTSSQILISIEMISLKADRLFISFSNLGSNRIKRDLKNLF